MATGYQEIIDCFSFVENYYSKKHEHDATVDEYIKGEYLIPKSKDAEAFKPATARDKVLHLTNMAMTIGARIVVPPWSQSEAVKKQCGRLERFAQAFIDRKELRIVKQTEMTHGLMYGVMCRQGPIYDKSLYPKEPNLVGVYGEKRKKAEEEYESAHRATFPFIFQAVNPQNAFPDPSDPNRPKFFVKKVYRKAKELKARYPDVDLSQYNDNENLEWREWWTEKEYAYFIGTLDITGVMENWLGYIPFDYVYCGLGFELPDGEPAERATGIIYPIIPAIRAKAGILTSMLDAIKLFPRGRERIALPPGQNFRLGRDGAIDVIGKEYEYAIDRPPALNQDAFSVLRMADDEIERGTVSSVAEGRNPIGVAPTSGFDRELAIASNRLTLQGPVSAYETLESNGLDKVAKCIRDVIEEPITVLGFFPDGVSEETVKPADFDHHPVFNVKLDGKTPEETSQRMAQGLNLWKAGAISWETMTKEYFGADVELERNKLWAEQVVNNDPNLRAAMAQKALQILGIDQQTEMVQDVARIRKKMGNQQPTNLQEPLEGMRTQQLLGAMGRPTPLNTPIEQRSPV